MSKDREKKVTRAREAKLEADLALTSKQLEAERELSSMLRAVASEAEEGRDEALRSALIWADRLKMVAEGSTCAYCMEPTPTPEKLTEFRAHIMACEKHPAHAVRDALEHARHEFVAATRIEDVQSKALLAVIDAALGPPPGPVMQPLVGAPAAAQEAV